MAVEVILQSELTCPTCGYRQSGCHRGTIQCYEHVGLVTKAASRANGYREYRTEEVERLRASQPQAA
ncbi:MAG: MerR family transcriptional regulator [Proteobacteria bacterium]|nr:MerR family transcriptional regulator [Pseudomonadota bacterium]